MKVHQLISLLQKEDPNMNIYVPFTTYSSPLSGIKIITEYVKDGEVLVLCAETVEEDDDDNNENT